MDHLPNEASDADIQALLLSDQSAVRSKFVEALSVEVDKLVPQLAMAYRSYRDLEAKTELSRRAAFVYGYAFAAFDSVLMSANLLLSGMQLPAGNLMRHYGEATAMALLCSHEGINTYDLLEKDPDTFPYHDALAIVNRKRNRDLLEIEEAAWREFMKVTSFYDRFSHASMFALASRTMFEAPGLMSLIGEFDPGKLKSYRIEMRRRNSAAAVLTILIRHLTRRLPPKADPSLPDAAT